MYMYMYIHMYMYMHIPCTCIYTCTCRCSNPTIAEIKEFFPGLHIPPHAYADYGIGSVMLSRTYLNSHVIDLGVGGEAESGLQIFNFH